MPTISEALSDGYSVAGTDTLAVPVAYRYRCTLTGTPDGEADLVIPMTSFEALLNDGITSYLRCTLAFNDTLLADVDARPNGELMVERAIVYSDNSFSAYALLLVANFDDYRFDLGPVNKSVTLTGTKITTNTAPKTRNIAQVLDARKQADGTRTWEIAGSNVIDPGDTAIIDAESVIIAKVEHLGTPFRNVLTIKEAA